MFFSSCLGGIKPFPGTHRGLKRLDELFLSYSYSERWIAAQSETRMCCEKLKPKEYVTSNVSPHGYWSILSDKRVVFLKYVISPKAFTGGERFLFSEGFLLTKRHTYTQTRTKPVCSVWRFSDKTQIEPNSFQAFYLPLHFNRVTHTET